MLRSSGKVFGYCTAGNHLELRPISKRTIIITPSLDYDGAMPSSCSRFWFLSFFSFHANVIFWLAFFVFSSFWVVVQLKSCHGILDDADVAATISKLLRWSLVAVVFLQVMCSGHNLRKRFRVPRRWRRRRKDLASRTRRWQRRISFCFETFPFSCCIIISKLESIFIGLVLFLSFVFHFYISILCYSPSSGIASSSALYFVCSFLPYFRFHGVRCRVRIMRTLISTPVHSWTGW